MGEWSRKIGEAGETLVGEYFKIIGWADAQKNVQLPCVKPEKHTLTGNPRQTHGIDFLFPYRSPLVDEVLNNLVVSVKFTNDAYPDNPTSKFKEHFADLAQTLECFKHSQMRQEMGVGQGGISRSVDIGVLFWLSNARNNDDNMIAQVARANVTTEFPYNTIYLVDNKCVAFVYDAFTYAQRLYSGSEIDFYFFDTGKNLNPLARQPNGKVLPVEFINSNVLPLRIAVKNSSNIVLMLLLNDEFSEGNLKRLMGMAQKFSGSWASKIELCFPDYFPLQHDNVVQKVKASFTDKQVTGSIEVSSFSSDFRNLQGTK